MRITDALREECVVPQARAGGKDEVLREAARAATKSGVLEGLTEEEIYNGLKEREALGSTGFGKGIAIPHCRLKAVREFVVGMIAYPDGVEFDSLDGQPVRLAVFIVAPEGKPDKNIRVLSTISQALMSPGAVDEIVAGGNSTVMVESFFRHCRQEIETKDAMGRSLFHVFVQDEDKFDEILHALSGAGSSSMVIVGAENAGVYLSKMPLFAGFWTDSPQVFSRIIIAAVDKKLVNEILRRIEGITGNLSEGAGVMVTVQDLVYSAGRLEP